ncbi:MAG: thiamine-phosphate kinase [Deltaproteobacteria bacterium]|nr:thiamine-phosphate kinase [Deltaproteobacteria bacterium]
MIDEFELLERIRLAVARADAAVEIGIGDDAAAIHLGGGRRLLLTTDALVAGVHFDPVTEPPADVARRAVAANVSDIAAMGGRPRWVLLSLVLPPGTDAAWVETLHKGFADAAAEAGAVVVGGNLACGRDLVLSLTVAGETQAAPLRRSGARAGDLIFLTGPVGASAAGRTAAGTGPAQAHEARSLRARYLHPPFRLDAAAVLARTASAAIDISDGLAQDLGHLADASGVAVALDLHRLPVAFGHPRDPDGAGRALALGGGEDYELAATVPPANLPLLSRLAAEAGIGLYRVGEVVSHHPPGTVLGVERDGSEHALPRTGFRHFG